MIRYVDSSGWTWEVCEVVRDLAAAADAAATPSRHDSSRGAPPRAPDRELYAPFTGGPADLPPRPPTRAATDARRAAQPFADDGALYFLSRIGTRKLRHYPPSWHELPRTELEALCLSAEVV